MSVAGHARVVDEREHGPPSSSSISLSSALESPLVTSAWKALALPPASSIASTVASAPASSER